MKTMIAAFLASLMLSPPAGAVVVKKNFKPGAATGYTRGGDFGTVIGPKANAAKAVLVRKAIGH